VTAQIDVHGIEAPVQVRRHPGARRLTLRISQTRRAVIVTMPLRCRIDEAGQFLHRNIDWVRERLGSMPAVVPFGDGASVPLRGERHRIFFAPAERGRPVVEPVRSDADGFVLVVRGHAEHCPRRLRDWLMEVARRDIAVRVGWHAENLRLRPSKIVIRNQTSRWGSCSSSGVLSFSWRLVMAPPFVLDYVAAHEVAHLAEINHGPRFWALVRKTLPDFDGAKHWLGQHGAELHRYGTAPGNPDSACKVC